MRALHMYALARLETTLTGLRERLAREERGSQTLEWIGIGAIVVALVTALAGAMGGIATDIATGIGTLITDILAAGGGGGAA